jgi:MFS superfamily sulfate permease-like transporter
MATLLLLMPLLSPLPYAVLAAIVVMALRSLLDLSTGLSLWRSSLPDFGLWAITLAATVLLGVEAGIGLGMAASMLWLIRQTSRPFWAELGRLPGTRIYRNVRRYRDAQHHAGVLILRFDAPLHFANKDYFARVLRQRERRFDPRHRRYMPPPPPPHAASAPVHLDAAAALVEAAQAAQAVVGGTATGPYNGHAEGIGRTVAT